MTGVATTDETKPAVAEKNVTLDEALAQQGLNPLLISPDAKAICVMLFGTVCAQDNIAQTIARVGTRLDHQLMLHRHELTQGVKTIHSALVPALGEIVGRGDSAPGWELLLLDVRNYARWAWSWARWFVVGGSPRFRPSRLFR